MQIQFTKTGNHKIGTKLVMAEKGQVFDVNASEIARYTEGVHYVQAGSAMPPAKPVPDTTPKLLKDKGSASKAGDSAGADSGGAGDAGKGADSGGAGAKA